MYAERINLLCHTTVASLLMLCLSLNKGMWCLTMVYCTISLYGFISLSSPKLFAPRERRVVHRINVEILFTALKSYSFDYTPATV